MRLPTGTTHGNQLTCTCGLYWAGVNEHDWICPD
jgi:hypothetical protein